MTQAGWHDDPTGRHKHRYHDGAGWTDHISDDGKQGSDPFAPPAPSTAQVKAAAPTPPTKGFNWRKVPWWGWVSGALLAIILIGALSPSSHKKSQSTSPQAIRTPRYGVLIDHPTAGQTIESKRLTVSGTAKPRGIVVRVKWDGETNGHRATTRADGTWTMHLTRPAGGATQLTADLPGHPGASSQFVTIDWGVGDSVAASEAAPVDTTPVVTEPVADSKATDYIDQRGHDMNVVQAAVLLAEGEVGIAQNHPGEVSLVDIAEAAQDAHDRIDSIRKNFLQTTTTDGELGNAQIDIYDGANELKNAMGGLVHYAGQPNAANLVHFKSQFEQAKADWNSGVQTVWSKARRHHSPSV